MEIGKVVDCKHCNGTAKCDCYKCMDYAKKHHHDTFYGRDCKSAPSLVLCTVCWGHGSVWVGPETIKVLMPRGK